MGISCAEGESSLMVYGTYPVEACDLLDRALKLFPNNADLINRDQEDRSLQADAAYRNQVATDEATTA